MRDIKQYNDGTINQLTTDVKRWFAVYTKYKCEKFVAQSLTKKSIEAYVPIITKTRKYAKKIKQYDIPLINCYVFVQISKEEYIHTLETEYVLKFLKQGKDLLAIPNEEIDILRRVVGDIIDITPYENCEIHAGEEVEVISGQLTGMRGKIVSQSGKRSFVVDLETIGYQIRIKVNFNLLKPVSARQLIA